MNNKTYFTMKTIKMFLELKELVRENAKTLRIAAVKPDDDATQVALQQIEGEGLAEVVTISNDIPEEAAREAVALVRNGEADVLMKGLIGTDQLLRAVLNKETGVLPQGHVLTHIAAAEIPAYQKLLFFTDAAVIPYPTHEQRIEQVRYIVDLCHKMGIEEPRIALNHCTEKPNEKYFPFTLGYRDIIEMGKQGEFGPCIIDGPLDLKTSISPESLRIKGIDSPIGGQADAVVFPDIEAGNVFYKAVTFFHGETAGMLVGPTVPVVLPSRADSKACKFNSLALASMMSNQ